MFVHQTSADVCDLLGFLNSAVKRNFKSLEVFGERKHVLICVFMSSRYRVGRNRSKFPSCQNQHSSPKRPRVSARPSEESTSENYPQFSCVASKGVVPNGSDWSGEASHVACGDVLYAYLSASCFRAGVLTPMWTWSYRLEDEEQDWLMKCSLIVAKQLLSMCNGWRVVFPQRLNSWPALSVHWGLDARLY